MKKLLTLSLSLFLLSSCLPPKTNGKIWHDDKGCTYLSNQSTDTKITFVLQYPVKDSVGYVYKFEQTVGPKEDAIIGCTEDTKTVEIIGGFVRNN